MEPEKADLREAIHLLRRGDWEAAHVIVQRYESGAGAYLHGVVHRMEGDVSNALYWFRRAVELADAVGTDPVDLTHRAAASPVPDDMLKTDFEKELTAVLAYLD
jgi:hypothetical protein